GWSGKGHFFGAAALAMRRLLVERARARRRLKRGGGRGRIVLEEHLVGGRMDGDGEPDWIAIDDALEALEEHDADLARLVNLRFFAGLTVEQTAAALGMSVRSVQ